MPAATHELTLTKIITRLVEDDRYIDCAPEKKALTHLLVTNLKYFIEHTSKEALAEAIKNLFSAVDSQKSVECPTTLKKKSRAFAAITALTPYCEKHHKKQLEKSFIKWLEMLQRHNGNSFDNFLHAVIPSLSPTYINWLIAQAKYVQSRELLRVIAFIHENLRIHSSYKEPIADTFKENLESGQAYALAFTAIRYINDSALLTEITGHVIKAMKQGFHEPDPGYEAFQHIIAHSKLTPAQAKAVLQHIEKSIASITSQQLIPCCALLPLIARYDCITEDMLTPIIQGIISLLKSLHENNNDKWKEINALKDALVELICIPKVLEIAKKPVLEAFSDMHNNETVYFLVRLIRLKTNDTESQFSRIQPLLFKIYLIKIETANEKNREQQIKKMRDLNRCYYSLYQLILSTNIDLKPIIEWLLADFHADKHAPYNYLKKIIDHKGLPLDQQTQQDLVNAMIARLEDPTYSIQIKIKICEILFLITSDQDESQSHLELIKKIMPVLTQAIRTQAYRPFKVKSDAFNILETYAARIPAQLLNDAVSAILTLEIDESACRVLNKLIPLLRFNHLQLLVEQLTKEKTQSLFRKIALFLCLKDRNDTVSWFSNADETERTSVYADFKTDTHILDALTRGVLDLYHEAEEQSDEKLKLRDTLADLIPHSAITNQTWERIHKLFKDSQDPYALYILAGLAQSNCAALDYLTNIKERLCQKIQEQSLNPLIIHKAVTLLMRAPNMTPELREALLQYYNNLQEPTRTGEGASLFKRPRLVWVKGAEQSSQCDSSNRTPSIR